MALADSIAPAELMAMAKEHGPGKVSAVEFAKNQFNTVVFARGAADAGLLRYVYFLAERL